MAWNNPGVQQKMQAPGFNPSAGISEQKPMAPRQLPYSQSQPSMSNPQGGISGGTNKPAQFGGNIGGNAQHGGSPMGPRAGAGGMQPSQGQMPSPVPRNDFGMSRSGGIGGSMPNQSPMGMRPDFWQTIMKLRGQQGGQFGGAIMENTKRNPNPGPMPDISGMLQGGIWDGQAGSGGQYGTNPPSPSGGSSNGGINGGGAIGPSYMPEGWWKNLPGMPQQPQQNPNIGNGTGSNSRDSTDWLQRHPEEAPQQNGAPAGWSQFEEWLKNQGDGHLMTGGMNQAPSDPRFKNAF